MRRRGLIGVGIITLAMVDIAGEMGGGAQRWLDIGVRFQPSEIMKLARACHAGLDAA